MAETNRYGDLLRELFQGVKNNDMSDPRLERIVEVFNELHQRENKYASFLRPQDDKIDENSLDLPIKVIYSRVLETDTASLIVPIPADINHVILKGNGGITAATGGTIWAQFNGDTGANYEDTYLLGNSTGATGGTGTALVQALIGEFSNTNDPVGNSSSFLAEISHVHSPYHKMVLVNTYYNDGTTRNLYAVGSKWKSTDPITSIELYGVDDTSVKGTANLAAGSLISIYGLK